MSIFNHPAADINILIKDVLKDFKEDQMGKVVPPEKHQARLVNARLEICLRMLEKIDVSKHKPYLKEIFELLAAPSLFHTTAEVRMGAVDLIGQLFRHIG